MLELVIMGRANITLSYSTGSIVATGVRVYSFVWCIIFKDVADLSSLY